MTHGDRSVKLFKVYSLRVCAFPCAIVLWYTNCNGELRVVSHDYVYITVETTITTHWTVPLIYSI
jgi:hypothetical protein